MFVRFRAVRHRLIVNLVASRRLDGKVVSEHIARLGSAALPEPISDGERILFWRDLKERWRDLIDRLGNRVTADDRKKALAAIHARIPKPTEAEWQAARIEAVRGILARCEQDRAYFDGRLESEREMIAKLEADAAEDRAAIDLSEAASDKTQSFLMQLLAGERIDGDDKVTVDHAIDAANKRDADIRAAPRPAARGRRGRQKRPRWSRRKEIDDDRIAQ